MLRNGMVLGRTAVLLGSAWCVGGCAVGGSADDAGVDVTPVDAGDREDAHLAADAGEVLDAARPADAGSIDAGLEHDAGIPGGATVFELTGAIESYTVPDGVTQLLVIAEGAAGGNAGGFGGGYGARVEASIDVTPGEVLAVLVGERPTDPAPVSCGASGGGGSFVARDTTALVVAGGGGGADDYLEYGSPGGNATLMPQGGRSSNLAGGIDGSGGECVHWEGAGGAGFTGDGESADYAVGGQAFVNGGAGGARDMRESCTGSGGGFGGGGGGGQDYGGGGGGYSGGAGRDPGLEPAGGGGSYAVDPDATFSLRFVREHGRVSILPR